MRRCIDVINTVFREKKYDGSKTTPAQFWDKNKVIDVVKHSGYDCGALMDQNFNFYNPPAPGKITFSLATFRQYFESGHLHHRNRFLFLPSPSSVSFHSMHLFHCTPFIAA